MIGKVTSGCQTGVDIAALRAARSVGIPTGGTMPRGFRTLDGPRPEYTALYGVVEHYSADYPSRTLANVDAADLTIRIAVDFSSAGERCTMGAIRRLNKLWVDVHLDAALRADPADIDLVAERIEAMSATLGRPIVLNVAGNSERRAPGIEAAAEVLLRGLFERCQATQPGSQVTRER